MQLRDTEDRATGLPFLFPEPETKDAWISRSVLGEQLWLEGGHDVFEESLPGVFNGLNAIAYLFGLFGAFKRNLRVTALGVALTCKLVYLQVLVNTSTRIRRQRLAPQRQTDTGIPHSAGELGKPARGGRSLSSSPVLTAGLSPAG